MARLQVRCPALGTDGRIPLRSAHKRVRGGENVSLPVSWSEVPPGTRSVVVTIIDHHPVARRWVHWCVAGLPPDLDALPEGASRQAQMLPPGVIETVNTYGEPGYGGPAPPLGSGPHPYVITVYALTGLPPFTRSLLAEARIVELMEGLVIAKGECTGEFERV